jgi:hypothetical protein
MGVSAARTLWNYCSIPQPECLIIGMRSILAPLENMCFTILLLSSYGWGTRELREKVCEACVSRLALRGTATGERR